MSTIRKEENISKVETIDCKITNKFVSSPISFEGPLNWREIVCTQPEKEEILRNWFNETGCWPKANSTPVFDVTDQIVYPGYSLDYPNVDKRGEAVGTAAFIKIRKADRNLKFHWTCDERDHPLLRVRRGWTFKNKKENCICFTLNL